VPGVRPIYTSCAIPECRRLVRAWSRYCPKHATRLTRYGDPLVMPLKPKEWLPHERYVADAFARYASRRGTQIALDLAAGVLAYRSVHGFTYQLEAEREFRRLTDAGVTPADLLRRAAVFYALLKHRPGRFGDRQKAEDINLGRFVSRLAPMSRRGNKTRSTSYRFIGELVREGCALWAGALLNTMEREAVEARERVRASGDLTMEAAP